MTDVDKEYRSTVSIIIPVWNHAEEILDCLHSIEVQTYRPIDVTIVDDGSTDNLSEVMESVQLDIPHCFIRLPENRGASAARNIGAKEVSGAYILFVDADVILKSDAIERMVEILERSDATFAYSSFRFGGKLFKSHSFDAEELRQHPFVHTTSLLRRSAFPGFDETLKKFQDWDLWLTILERGGKGVWIPKELFEVTVSKKRESIQLSQWLPRFVHILPWGLIGWMPNELKKYRYWEGIVKKKHGISS
jgi:glycosyltransferase involved in cell wall biosynthesis